MPIYVLEDHDRAVHHHSRGERQSGKHDDIQGPAQGIQDHKGRHEGDGDREGEDEDTGGTPQEKQEDRYRQKGAVEEVGGHQFHRIIDIVGFVIDLDQLDILSPVQIV